MFMHAYIHMYAYNNEHVLTSDDEPSLDPTHKPKNMDSIHTQELQLLHINKRRHTHTGNQYNYPQSTSAM